MLNESKFSFTATLTTICAGWWSVIRWFISLAYLGSKNTNRFRDEMWSDAILTHLYCRENKENLISQSSIETRSISRLFLKNFVKPIALDDYDVLINGINANKLNTSPIFRTICFISCWTVIKNEISAGRWMSLTSRRIRYSIIVLFNGQFIKYCRWIYFRQMNLEKMLTWMNVHHI